jgi:hypothetical protein
MKFFAEALIVNRKKGKIAGDSGDIATWLGVQIPATPQTQFGPVLPKQVSREHFNAYSHKL